MSVLIKGMEMPKEGYKGIYVHSNGSVYESTNSEYIWHKIASAVPVPPHGDLIDRKALLEGEGRYLISLCKEGIDIEEILRAKTVIPASEEE